MKRASKWAVALLVSGVVHAGAAAVLLAPGRDEVEIAGSAGLEIALLGSFEDAWEAGEPVDDAEVMDATPTEDALAPVENAEVVDEAEPERALATLTPPVAPVLPATPDVPAQAPQTPISPAETAPALEPVLPDVPPQASIHVPFATDAVPVEVEPETATAMVSPVEAIEGARPLPIAPARPAPAAEVVDDLPVAEPVEEIVIPDDVPLPTARPEPPTVREAMARPEPARPAPRREERLPQRTAPAPKSEKSRVAPERKAAGAGGQEDRNATRGQADGRADGRASAQGGGTNAAGASGNARVSNYPGQVVARLKRSLRGVPRSAIRQASRDVHVAFTVDAGGGIGGVRITQSSGSPELDQAALASVRRAAPFPPIPADAGRSSWQFSVPLGLAR